MTTKKGITLKAKGYAITKCSVCGTVTAQTYYTLNKGTKFVRDSAQYQVSVKDKTVNLIKYTNKKASNVVISSVVDYGGVRYTITGIGGTAFTNNKQIKTIVLPATLKIVARGAFNGCKNLKLVKFTGTATAWKAIKVGGLNTPLRKAKVTCSGSLKCALAKTKYAYSGKVITPKVTVKDTRGKLLVQNKDYTVTYAKGRKLAGKYAVKVTFKGIYAGSRMLYFNIIATGKG